MAHLTCTKHGRRVFVVRPDVVIHRNGDGKSCGTLELAMGNMSLENLARATGLIGMPVVSRKSKK